MKRNYTPMLLSLVFIAVLLLPGFLLSQEPKVFTRDDFDLLGQVKTCLVITDYGKETFEFNEKGFLTKSVTSYNAKDYDITYYKYKGKDLAEKRSEIYRDGVFDKNTSIAHLFEIDTIGQKNIVEQIFSYNEDFLDKYEYQFNLEGRLVRVLRSNNDGLDETTVEYTNYKGEQTVSYLLNGVIKKSIRTSFRKKKDGGQEQIELTKEFLEGIPNKAVEKVFDKSNRVSSEQNFVYNTRESSFVPKELINYQYNERGILSAQFTKVGQLVEEKEFIYQFDNGEKGNWIKKIVTPENSYTTRHIEYYPEEEVEVEE